MICLVYSILYSVSSIDLKNELVFNWFRKNHKLLIIKKYEEKKMKDCMLSNYPKMSILALVLISVGMGFGLTTSKTLLGIFLLAIGFLIFFLVFIKFTRKHIKNKRCHPSH
jgi:hypothetical protein